MSLSSKQLQSVPTLPKYTHPEHFGFIKNYISNVTDDMLYIWLRNILVSLYHQKNS